MSRFEYLGASIIYSLALYFLIVISVLLIYYYQCYRPQRRLASSPSLVSSSVATATTTNTSQENMITEIRLFAEAYFHGKSFESTYQHAFIPGLIGQYMLLIFRCLAFGFFFSIPFVWRYTVDQGGGAHYYTIWNIDLITGYFLMTILASVWGIFYDHPPSDNTATVRSGYVTKYGYMIQILFEIATASAFFVTVIDYVGINQSFGFWNVMEHFLNTIIMLIECLCNSMDARIEHLAINLTWPLLYLLFIWPIVAEGVLSDWPYAFLATDTKSVYGWYTILIVVDMIFYGIFWCIVQGKYKFLKHYWYVNHNNNNDNNEEIHTDHNQKNNQGFELIEEKGYANVF